MSHRALLAASLAEGRTRVTNLVFSEDIEATCDVAGALGARFVRDGDTVTVRGVCPPRAPSGPVDCRESGSTLRFMIPIACLAGAPVEFRGRGELVTRPLTPYFDLFEKHGIRYVYEGRLPLTVDGKLEGGIYELPGNVSSQFVTGLLLALPTLDGDSEIRLTTKLESADYVDLTLQMMERFGVRAEAEGSDRYFVPGGQSYRAADYRVEGDYSQAAFWIAAGMLSGGLELTDLEENSRQGDKRILDIARSMGARLEWSGGRLLVRRDRPRAAIVDASQCPDLVPMVAALAAVAEGTTRIVNAGRVRIKESDRLKAMATELNKLGARVTEEPEGLVIEGVPRLSGGTVDGWNDHRIVMSLAVAAIAADGPVTIVGHEAVRKSYPHFFDDYRALGGAVSQEGQVS
jgi:3-phosphoshikimate 1-carboxyvinyltransferase